MMEKVTFYKSTLDVDVVAFKMKMFIKVSCSRFLSYFIPSKLDSR